MVLYQKYEVVKKVLFVVLLLVPFFSEAATGWSLEKMKLVVNGDQVLPSNGSVTGVWYYTPDAKSSQILLLGHEDRHNWQLRCDLLPSHEVQLFIPVSTPITEKDISSFVCDIDAATPNKIDIKWKVKPNDSSRVLLTIKAQQAVMFTLRQFRDIRNGQNKPLSLDPQRRPLSGDPIPAMPDLRPYLAHALIEWDWRMQDGIETPRESRTFRQALEKRIPQIQELVADLEENGDGEKVNENITARWKELVARFEKSTNLGDHSPEMERLWQDIHAFRREVLLQNSLFKTGSLVFAKHIPTALSHQLEQEYGYLARPGGGIFILDQPGQSMETRCLTKGMPDGNYKHPTVSFDGKLIYFAFCKAPQGPNVLYQPDCMPRKYHIWSMNADGSDPKQITDGPNDDFAPTVLPDGNVVFSSTRRGGFHRCGGGPCPVYTLAKMKGNGDDPHVLSFHETQEWSPSLLNDGRIVYTRWDYVDRDASFYQNLWSVRQDGTDVRILYGNNTFSPHGIWEAKAIPDSKKIMALGGPHHSIAAGSLMIIDPVKGVDGSDPVQRITPEVLYPESEIPLPQSPGLPARVDYDTVCHGAWNGNIPFREADRIKKMPEEESRWPVHCFKSPWPLSEKYYIASYSFDKLVGEMGGNIPNQFGLYFCDVFGSRELIYRDPNISSVWAMPLKERPAPPAYVSTLPQGKDVDSSGLFYVQNVYETWPYSMPKDVKALRIVQVLPKTTPNANQPKIGEPNASPGKQVLGTVPVEKDGSAFFRVPAKIPVLFQALDDKGRAVQWMRSLVYLQPGEVSSCTGCHENRMSSSPVGTSIAYKRAPSEIKPAPDGSKPFSYPILVQPVLDRLCVECHNNTRTEGKINLTGEPDGVYTKSYKALIPFVKYSAWGLPQGNHEPYTEPKRFGAVASKLSQILDAGHYHCALSAEDWDRLNTWMDANSLFYGTFNVDQQKKQQNGERISGPDLE